MNHIITALIILLITVALFVILLFYKKMTLELFSVLLIIVIAATGYIYQSGENRRMQDLEYKRETYASLMENLAIFKRTGKTNDDLRNMEKSYYRSWAETSDEVNIKLLNYFKAYEKWSNNKNPANEQNEKDMFDMLVNQIKKEINPSSTARFFPYYFELKEKE